MRPSSAQDSAAQPSGSYLSIAAAIVIAGVLVSASLFAAVGDATRTISTTATRTLTTTDTPVTNHEVFLLNVSGAYYWAVDVTNDIVIGSPGYSYFLNGSVAFDGVKFRTVCSSNYDGCPGSNSSSTMVWADAILLKMTFPDGTSETVGRAGFFTALPTYVLSQNSTPIAGMLIEYVNDYPHCSAPYAVFLLVSSCGAPPHIC